ncbi:transporter [Chryseobacterium wangxinyae]|uniref:transporter n=1 Tax=Chryseobacterium sp. CY350 TaxID=2997336 RepID=UPI00227153D0|nr:transporter [Chryseobacterium sp. CY350]MCY0976520.1 transporter [Chryseobacterium sp. CY350]WBZ96523.1 transporter [Chryseobacterium sp. CY350]
MISNRISKLFLGAIILPFACYGQKELPYNYSLFKPVPKSMMREMETDRPDVTESPYTVDAGHFQYETDFVRLVKEKTEEKKTNTLLINQANIKIGLTKSTAIQIGFQTYGKQKETDIATGNKEITNGFGDVTLRVKQNLIGNDQGNFAMALLPYVKFPTSKCDEESRFEGGLIIPMMYKLPGEWNLGFQVEVDRLKDQDQPSMHTEFLQTLTISHQILKNVDGIAETYYTYDFKEHHFSSFLNAAVQMKVVKDFKFDVGINYGLQHDAEKQFFFGASYRL